MILRRSFIDFQDFSRLLGFLKMFWIFYKSVGDIWTDLPLGLNSEIFAIPTA